MPPVEITMPQFVKNYFLLLKVGSYSPKVVANDHFIRGIGMQVSLPNPIAYGGLSDSANYSRCFQINIYPSGFTFLLKAFKVFYHFIFHTGVLFHR